MAILGVNSTGSSHFCDDGNNVLSNIVAADNDAIDGGGRGNPSVDNIQFNSRNVGNTEDDEVVAANPDVYKGPDAAMGCPSPQSLPAFIGRKASNDVAANSIGTTPTSSVVSSLASPEGACENAAAALRKSPAEGRVEERQKI
jgi:hypothetical protein